MKRWGLVGGLLLAIGCILFGVIAYLQANPRETAETRVQAAIVERAEIAKAPVVSQVPVKTAPVYVSPVDFDDLREMNPDIYAWLYIPDTEVNYPILQREGNDAFYLRHNSNGKYSKAGAIFTEETYTKKDFSDPVTVIYGHYMRSGTLFGSLQTTYSTLEGMEAHRDVIVYLPDQELRYEVFAAVPHDMLHILYYNDFTDPEVFQAFLEQVLSVRSINACIDRSVEVTVEDQLLILSTCLRGDSHQRYLVLAKRAAESTAP